MKYTCFWDTFLSIVSPPSHLFDLGLLGVQGGLLRRDEAHQLGEVRRRRAALQTEKENEFLVPFKLLHKKYKQEN